MNPTNPTAGGHSAGGILDRWQARRERKFHERREQMAGWFPKLRNRAMRRRLVVAQLVMLVLFAVAGVLLAAALTGAIATWWSLVWMVVTFIALPTWTILGIVTDNIDGAPASCLDEYERERVEGLRSLAYRAFTWLGLFTALALIIVGTWVMNDAPDWARYVPYFAGISFLVCFLAILSLPTIVIAWTMADD
ncbi:hypothetical protein ACFORJ_08900 [Corynebacterium hansenii]|uniref:Uncharacterized protein n=1 Tax=Corynebacterium hansenii TaxID=394964 RepID=A0ABV7ZQ74_9CORY|nr:hypothetical protein [Corynebacterium hansenii]WJZ00869.1 hypothetical protein CHAN_11360 [Corynebacterium hansenii]